MVEVGLDIFQQRWKRIVVGRTIDKEGTAEKMMLTIGSHKLISRSHIATTKVPCGSVNMADCILEQFFINARGELVMFFK